MAGTYSLTLRGDLDRKLTIEEMDGNLLYLQENGGGGSQGPQGDQGYQGPTGPQGFQGVTGPQGGSGFNGFQGPTGPQGLVGMMGTPGVQGPTGSGATGSQGSQGPQGDQGYQGFQGPTGSSQIFTQVISISSADILNMFSVPYTLLGPPSAGFYKILGVDGSLTYGTASYDTNTDLQVMWASGGSPIATCTTLLSSASSIGRIFTMMGDVDIFVGNGVKIKVANGNPLNGNGTLTIYITYKETSLS